MLEKLALKHELWVKMAKGICKDAYLADDLVSEMYLKMFEITDDTIIKNSYVRKVIYNLFIDYLRHEKKLNEVELNDNYVTFYEEERITIELPNCITWVEKQILILRQQFSCRDISKKYHINKDKVSRIELKAKEKLKEWAKEKSKELVIS